MAFLSALENISTIETGNTKVKIYTDSAYIANCFADKWYVKWRENGWKTSDKQPVKNQDLWTRILALYIKYHTRFDIEIIKVKSHAGNVYNEYVDAMAVTRRKELEEDQMLFNFLDKELEDFPKLEPWQINGFVTVLLNDYVLVQLDEEDEE